MTVAPKIAASGSDTQLLVTEGRPVEMECDVTGGDPEPEVTWSKDGVAVSPGASGVHALRLSAAVVEHAGSYVCTAENVAGVARKRFRLRVSGTFWSSSISPVKRDIHSTHYN